jgi:hypothetical protein
VFSLWRKGKQAGAGIQDFLTELRNRAAQKEKGRVAQAVQRALFEQKVNLSA